MNGTIETVLLMVLGFGLIGLMFGAAWFHDSVAPMLRERARRKHELALEQAKLERERLEAAKPVCSSCGHGLGYHQGGMACQADAEHPVERSENGTVTRADLHPCKCTEYTGQAAGLSGSILRELEQ